MVDKQLTAICFTGQCRSLEFTHKNIKENLLARLEDYDIFMYVSDNASAYKAKKYMDPTELRIEPDPVLDLQNINHIQATERGGINGFMQMLHGMKKCNEMRKEYEKKTGIKYQRIIKSRLDIKFFDKFPLDFDSYDIENFVYTPDFHCYECVRGAGYNDRFAVGNRQNMDMYLSEFDYIKKYSSLGHIVHAESSLHYHLKQHNIKVKKAPIRFTRVREGGKQIDLHIENSPLTWKPQERCL